MSVPSSGHVHHLLQAVLIQRVAARQRDRIQQHLVTHCTVPVGVHLRLRLVPLLTARGHGFVPLSWKLNLSAVRVVRCLLRCTTVLWELIWVLSIVYADLSTRSTGFKQQDTRESAGEKSGVEWRRRDESGDTREAVGHKQRCRVDVNAF